MRATQITVVALLALLTGCARNADTPADTAGADTAAADTASAMRLQAEVTRLEARLRELASDSGCETLSQCKTVPVGERACGGPREYVVYCAVSTDEPALLAVAESLKQAEMAHNEATGAVSTCEMRLAPDLTIEAGECKAVDK